MNGMADFSNADKKRADARCVNIFEGIMMKRSIILTVVIDLLLLALGRGILSVPETPVLQEENVEQAFENILPCTVRLQSGEVYGSGSIYCLTADEMIVVTAGHLLVSNRQEWEITFYDGKKTAGRLIGVSDEADVGFIGISLSALSKEELMQLCRAKTDWDAWEKFGKNSCFFMADVISDNKQPICIQGAMVEKEMFLSDYGRAMMYGDAYAHPGMSGCGIFDGYGNFVGILSGATEQNEIAAVPLTEIEEVYKKTGLFPA